MLVKLLKELIAHDIEENDKEESKYILFLVIYKIFVKYLRDRLNLFIMITL